MNERIKEIWDKAAKAHGGDTWEEQTAFLENFAELLILECIDLVETTPRHCAFTTYDLSTVECTIQKSSERLHEHFGLQRKFKITSGQLPVSK